MQTFRFTARAAAFGFVILFPLAVSHAQQLTSAQDSVVAMVAEVNGLPLVAPEDLPRYGTFWTAHSSIPCLVAPLPMPPTDADWPVYQIGPGQFLVDQTGGQTLSAPSRARLTEGTAAVLLNAQVQELMGHVAWLQGVELAKTEVMLLGAPDPPGGGGGGGTNQWPDPSFEAPMHTTNDLWLEIKGLTNSVGELVIHPPWNETNGVYDLFSTTNLAPAWWEWVLLSSAGQTNLTVTNLTGAMVFFLLGRTNDTDAGGMTDAYEGLRGLNASQASDDLLTPVVSVGITDSTAMEASTNTAAFSIQRLGGNLKWPLAVSFQISGTATVATDYTLAPGTVGSASNLVVTIPEGQTNVMLTLTAVSDAAVEGTETATLTLETNAGWTVNSNRSSATAWVLESYSKTYTTVADFRLGVLNGLEAVEPTPNGELRFKTNLPAQFPYINVACSDRGTVARINTTNGQVIGEYRTVPAGMLFTGDSGAGAQPSRTTVDLFGNVWVANRADDFAMNRTNYGSITRIGLVMGTRYSKTDGQYYLDPTGQYVCVTNAVYNTCIDRDGDGYIRTSTGLADILPWSNQRGGMSDADTRGGVSTAEDEAIVQYVRVDCTKTRTIAVDKLNDIWVGGTGNRAHVKVNGLTGSVVPGSAFWPSAGGYGGVIDSLGALWSSPGIGQLPLLRLTPPTNLPLTAANWDPLWTADNSADGQTYGIAVDPVHARVWQTVNATGKLLWWHLEGYAQTNANGLEQLDGGWSSAQGLAVDAQGHVWVAHGSTENTVGHLDTNGAWLGNATLKLARLRAEYYGNTNLSGFPILVGADAPIDFAWGAGSPDPIVPTNYFSCRWTGMIRGQVEGDHVFYVSGDAGAGFRLRIGGVMVIENWNNPDPNPVELRATNYLSTGDSSFELEYKETTGDASIQVSWMLPGSGDKVVIPSSQLMGPDLGRSGPTGISIDSLGNIWAANKANSTAMRINPNRGEMVVTNGRTNFVGEVDMVVDLGDGSGHSAPYNVAAGPYNYSDMTGFNNRVVNPALQPLKGYWTVIEDCRHDNEVWERLTWTDNLPLIGCAVEVFVRSSNSRQNLANEPFVAVTNDVAVADVLGRYIEVRVALTRNSGGQEPALKDLTLHGASSGFVGDLFLEDQGYYEGEDAEFNLTLEGPEPMNYLWQVWRPWADDWEAASAANGPELVLTNVDLWDDWTWVRVAVSNSAGHTLTFGPSLLQVYPLSMKLPGSGSSGPAERYPATINVRGEPTNGLSRVEVTLYGLDHAYPADLDILLVSPSGAKIMLMSDAGSSFAVTNATLVFHPTAQSWPAPPEQGSLTSNETLDCSTANYGDQETQIPGAPEGPYTDILDNLPALYANPNGVWQLYIHDDKTGQTGALQASWNLEFFYN